MPTTPVLSFPYPAPTDPVAQGAAAIRSLAEALEGYSAPFFVKKLTAVGNSLLIPAGTFPTKFEAIEIGCYLFQAGNTNDNTNWIFRVYGSNGAMISGDFGYSLVGQQGTNGLGTGPFREPFMRCGNIYTHLSAGGVQPSAFGRIRIESPSEARRHFVSMESWSMTAMSGNPGQDYNVLSGRAAVPCDNVANLAITGCEIFASSGPGFGVGSAIWARGIGARSIGVTLLPGLGENPPGVDWHDDEPA